MYEKVVTLNSMELDIKITSKYRYQRLAAGCWLY